MSDTPETNAAAFDAFDGQGGEVVFADFAKKLERERNEARELARDIYWAGYELRRFARAYANDYDECDGKPAAIQADHAFSEASINVAKVLGEEEAAK